MKTKPAKTSVVQKKIKTLAVFFQALLSALGNGMAKRPYGRQEFDRNENSGPSAPLVGSSQQSLDEQHKIGSSPAVMESFSPLVRVGAVLFVMHSARRAGAAWCIARRAAGARSLSLPSAPTIGIGLPFALCTHIYCAHTRTQSDTTQRQAQITLKEFLPIDWRQMISSDFSQRQNIYTRARVYGKRITEMKVRILCAQHHSDGLEINRANLNEYQIFNVEFLYCSEFAVKNSQIRFKPSWDWNIEHLQTATVGFCSGGNRGIEGGSFHAPQD
jgi:hypothetical protein